MIPAILVLLPFAFAAAILLARHRPIVCRSLLIACGVSHFALACITRLPAAAPFLDMRLIGLDPGDIIQSAVLFAMSLLFLGSAIHAYHWIPAAYALESHGGEARFMRESTFLACTAAFLGAMTLVVVAKNLGLLWVAIEATTLLSAPLIGFHRTAGAIEATWKYMLICSVGIGFALFGTMLVAYAAQLGSGGHIGLDLASLQEASFDPVWFKAGFIFILAGYGTKMGLAPFHSWLPDAHGESPATASALLSGALLNCSFLAITRFRALAPAAVEPFCDQLMTALGLLSLAVAAAFIVRQHDFKRMLAYSSVENMGLVIILFALGSELLSLHIVIHSLLKMSLFLVAGNILLAYGTRHIGGVHAMLAHKPRLAALWIAGILLLCATPPSPLFLTEYALVSKAGLALGGTVLFLVLVVFIGMARIAVSMSMGQCSETDMTPRPIPRALRVVPTLGIGAALVVGLIAFVSLAIPTP
ncbi:MAG: proton-conducting transporter membrane subunit [Kiritimatiellia bacterium]|jgi:hydrogenase-4 component F